jgi:hypothetical protein
LLNLSDLVGLFGDGGGQLHLILQELIKLLLPVLQGEDLLIEIYSLVILAHEWKCVV